jgi:tRNA threonylcarbamoyladenosine biosynthesis protein TsaB
MKMLAIDTSTHVLGVSIFDGKTILNETVINAARNHSALLIPSIVDCLKVLHKGMADIDVLAVSAGPGSYTGVRIGVTTAKTIAWACSIPLYSVSSLKILAMNGIRFNGLVVPLFDARRERVYSGVYQSKDGEMQSLLSDRVISISTWLQQIKELAQPVLFLGDGATLFQSLITKSYGDQSSFGTPTENMLRPSYLAQLAWEKWRMKELPEDIDFTPNYLQVTQAETKLLEKQTGVCSYEQQSES